MGLMGLFRYYVRGKISAMNRDNMRMCVLPAGWWIFPEDVQDILHEAEEQTGNNTLHGSDFLYQLRGAPRNFRRHQPSFSLRKDGIRDEDDLRPYLYLPDVPDPDLLIRAAHEQFLAVERGVQRILLFR